MTTSGMQQSSNTELLSMPWLTDIMCNTQLHTYRFCISHLQNAMKQQCHHTLKGPLIYVVFLVIFDTIVDK